MTKWNRCFRPPTWCSICSVIDVMSGWVAVCDYSVEVGKSYRIQGESPFPQSKAQAQQTQTVVVDLHEGPIVGRAIGCQCRRDPQFRKRR